MGGGRRDRQTEGEGGEESGNCSQNNMRVMWGKVVIQNQMGTKILKANIRASDSSKIYYETDPLPVYGGACLFPSIVYRNQ